MLRNSLIVGTALAVALCMSGLTMTHAADSPAKKRRVVLQVSEDDSHTWRHALNIAENMPRNAGKDPVEIRIVAMSPGIKFVENGSSAEDRLQALIKNGVSIVACGTTMSYLKWGADRLIRGVTIVPAGALEIVDLQNDGWAYIKP